MTRPIRQMWVAAFCVFGSMAIGDELTNPTRLQLISQTVSDEIPLVIAHRGASGYLPEHTTESAVMAHAMGADYIEQDVVLSKDGQPIVAHDVTLDSITDVTDAFPGRDRDGKFYVFDFTLKELRTLNVTERDDRRFPQKSGRFRLKTLGEHIELIHGLNKSRGRKAGLYVEIKRPGLHRENGLDPTKVVLATLNHYGYSNADDRVFLQCFEEPEVIRIRDEFQCRLPLIQLYGDSPTDEQLTRIAKYADGIGIKVAHVVAGAKNDVPQLTDLVKRAHQRTLMVHAWTLRDDRLPEYCSSPKQLIDWLVRSGGVDGIFTDHPDTLVKWRSKLRQVGQLQGPFHLLNDSSRN